ncbi:MAG: hypothetical protein R2711_08380 [Acidimicrobiales bacterium]
MRTWGESETSLAERLAGRIEVLDGSGNPTLAYNASGIEGIKPRLTAKGPDQAVAAEALVAEEEQIRAIPRPRVRRGRRDHRGVSVLAPAIARPHLGLPSRSPAG